MRGAVDEATNTLPHRAFEDLPVGFTTSHGPVTVGEDAIVGFAAEFDPQPMHLDRVAGEASLLRGLAASGWHTCALFMRMLCDGLLLDSTSMGSPGVDELKWLRPVRPGDALTLNATVVDARASRSRPEVGLVRFEFVVTNQRAEAVMSMANVVMFRRRGTGAAA
jgi:acyl dehydratase